MKNLNRDTKVGFKRKHDFTLSVKMVFHSILALVIISLILFLILRTTGYFSKNQQEVKDILDLQQKNTIVTLNDYMDGTEAKSIALSKELSLAINEFLVTENIELEMLNDNSQMIGKFEEKITSILSSQLKAAYATGIYAVFNFTCNTSIPGNDKAGVYLRRGDFNCNNLDGKKIYLFRGDAKIGYEKGYPLHSRWDLEFDTSFTDVYSKILNIKVDRIDNSCIWTEPVRLKDTWENVILVTVPIIDRNNVTIGVCGLEVSEMYFNYSFPVIKSKFGDIDEQFAIVNKNKIYMVPNDLNRTNVETFYIKPEKYFYIYEGTNSSYIGIHEILPAKLMGDSYLSIATILSKESYEEAVNKSNNRRFIALIVFFILISVITLLWLNHFIAPWSKLVEKIKKGESIEEDNYNSQEVSDLIAYFNQSSDPTKKSNLPTEIEELIINFAEKVKTLTPMEKTILQYYIEGYTLNEIADKTFISINTAKKHNTNINRKLGISNREELMVYIDIFRRCNKLSEIEKEDK